MGAGFLPKDQKAKQRERTIENAAQGVSEFYTELGPDFRRALFFACMRVWASGASTTLMRLNNEVRPHIVNAFKYGEDIAGVLLKKNGFEFTPIYMTTPQLADKLASRADLYMDFREVRKELGL